MSTDLAAVFNRNYKFFNKLLVQQGGLGVLVEEVQALGIECDNDVVTGTGGGARIDAGDDVAILAGGGQVQVGLRAHLLGHFHLHNNFGDGDNHLPLSEGSMNMDSIFMAIEKNCGSDVTFTIESRDAKSSLIWLKEHNYF